MNYDHRSHFLAKYGSTQVVQKWLDTEQDSDKRALFVRHLRENPSLTPEFLRTTYHKIAPAYAKAHPNWTDA